MGRGCPVLRGSHVLLSSPLWGAPGGLPLDILGLAGAWVSLSAALGLCLGCQQALPWGSFWVGGMRRSAYRVGAHPAWCERLGSPMASLFSSPATLASTGSRSLEGLTHASPARTPFWGRSCQERRPAGGVAGARTHPAGLQLTKIPGACSHLLPRPCRRAKAQGGGFVWAAVSLGCEHSSGTRQNCRFQFFTVFSFQFM